MSRQKNLKRNLLICLLAGSAVMYTLPLHAATSVVANNALPTLPMVNGQIKDGYGFVTGGSNTNIVTDGFQMNITQNDLNAVIKWGSFDVGGSATVNFKGPESGYNTLNYVNAGGSMSQIYGTINANNNGNIFIVNPAGVQIGNSAQINVGSLYVSNKYLNENKLAEFDGSNINSLIDTTKTANAELMSLGNINAANNVTFDGNRIVLDTDRVIITDPQNGKLNIKTTDTNNVVLGYEAYDENTKYQHTVGNEANFDVTKVTVENGNISEKTDTVKGYMWVEDVEQLQAIDTNLSGNYALRNSIDATATKNWNNGFSSIGVDENGKINETGFTGKFDGIDYNIFGLTINRSNETNVGLFGAATDATINNVTLVGGSISGYSDVGAIVGAAKNTTISNVTNSAKVEGTNNVGGIVGIVDNTAVENAINTGIVDAAGYNIGGLIGYMNNSNLGGNSYNLGDVSSEWENVGGLVGHAVNSTIGDGTNLVYNRLDVEGAYNVGGIVGNMQGTTVQNAENSGNVTATKYDNGKYTFHTDYDQDGYSKDGIKTVDVNVANVGGIAGTASANSTITDVLNTANVSSKQQNNNDYYDAGNVGGIVGSAVDTNISNVTNKENEVRGAHNVGGVAGYFGGVGTVSGGVNDGGDIMATGARYTNNGITAVVTETIRKDYDGSNNDGKYVIGNIGGIVGYMEGDNVHIDASGNRGTVHTLDISDGNNISDASEAANVGGIVGKIDRSSKITDKNELGENYVNAAVSNSYNTGDVRGFTAIGGIAGMMYNGGIAGAYNLGEIRSTRVATGNETPLNMGGIVGDTTEVSNARAFIYDVYNKGKIGDETFKYKGRHVGGIVGRLSGVVEKAYNTGAIYNGAAVTGGIAGYLSAGKIENVFNTGNITVENNDGENLGTQLGGLVGAANIGRGNVNISNAYNLGVIRSFNGVKQQHNVGGIVGYLVNYKSNLQGEDEGKLTIENVYTTGDLYSEGGKATVGAVYGGRRDNNINPDIQNAVYITPSNNDFTESNLQGAVTVTGMYGSIDAATEVWNNFIKQSNVNNEDQSLGLWRVYNGTTPILNAFMPNSKDYFGDENQYYTGSDTGIDKIQYGTAYNPLLTIINANKDLVYDWEKLRINNDAGLAVYGYGVTLNNFRATGGTGYFGGTIYADGALNLNGSSDIGLGSASQIYGSDVTIATNGKVTIYGDVTATGNEKDNNDTTGSITINAGEVDVYGTLTSAKKDQQLQISGIAGGVNPYFKFENIKDKTKPVTNVGDRFAHEVTASETGNITINAGQNGTGSGNVNLYYGNKQEGLITTGGNLEVTGTGDVYVDSDLDIGGDLTLTGNGENSEVVLDLTNIGQVQAKNGTANSALDGFHDFMHHFGSQTGDDDRQITLNAKISGDAKLTIDMWDETQNNGQGGYNLEKYDQNTGHDLVSELNNLNIKANIKNNNGTIGDVTSARPITYIWVSDGDQLQAINNNGVNGLSYNYALKNDINASDVTDYEAIGGTTGFTGTFDGRGNRIIGLNVDGDNAGIFSTIGASGTVKNVNIYSSNFTGTDNAGAIAGVNKGRIENIVTFGNRVEAHGSDNSITINGESVGAAGGIAGINDGYIYDVGTTGTVIAGSAVTGSSALSTAGGIVGINNANATVDFSYSDSAVTASDNSTYGLGGVAGINNGTLKLVDSLGVTRGLYVDQNGNYLAQSGQVGGIVGINNNTINSGYNESIVTGLTEVGGIAGVNNDDGTINSVVNAVSVTGDGKDAADSQDKVAGYYVGGLVGTNNGSVTDGRNNGTITGNEYVGGMVGSNANGSTLNNLVNGESADIIGENYVGGIVGKNSGSISANDSNLENRGSITGQNYVGGVAGLNTGSITNTNNDVSLNVKDSTDEAQYFGGVVGKNEGKIEKSTNSANIVANGATYVGGITGHNTGNLVGMGNSNKGNVVGKDYVGGVIGWNEGNIGSSGTTVEIVNSGIVEATAGGAGGLIAYNKGDLTNVEMTNAGKVTGTATNGTSGTGGLIGYNEGDITGSVLENTVGFVSDGVTLDGDVTGLSNVGGVIGVNTGKIENTSLMNKADITVTVGENQKAENIGGLIGKNTGTILGGRDDADSYYKYQIYNNGTINVTGEGTHIGGLFGTNSGTVEAAYNTGVIDAGQSSNVGGIAGVNEQGGKLDQVFNTVMTGVDDKGNTVYGTITGKDNVGGLVGTNSGTLSNAYNTTVVNGAKGSTGNAVGVNGTNGTINNIYANNISGNLIGNAQGTINNAYSFSSGDEGSKVVKFVDDVDTDKDGIKDRVDKDSYTGFDFTDDWKNYDGSGNPLLKVFLTKASYSGNSEFTYNGQNQGVDIEKITAFDQLNAYKNANDLLQNLTNKDSGNYTIYSQQIAASGKGEDFNPNNLGYDIDTTYTIKKVNLKVYLDEISRKYGNAAITNITNGSDDYGFNFGNIVLTQEMLAELTSDNLGFNIVEDGAVKDITGDRKTNNAGEYNWRATFSLSDELAKNYQFDNNGSTNFEITNGKSIVTAVDLTIDLNDISRVYGNLDKGNYQFNATGLVNGDEIADLILKVTNDGAIAAGTIDNPQKTASVGTYEWSGTVSNADNTLSTNYNIKYVDDGKAVSEVTPAKLNIKVDNVNTTVGKMPGELTGTVEGLTNGDTLPTHDFALKDDSLISVSGNHEDVIGIVIGGKFYELGDADWSNGLFANYDVNYEMGDLAVSVVEIPDNWPNNRWDYLFADNPFDRNENFRERKAEVNFVDGAMEI